MKLFSISFIFFFLALSLTSSAQWVQTNGPTGSIIMYTFSDGNSLFVSDFNQTYYSADLGQTWNILSGGLPSPVFPVEMDTSEGVLYLATYSAIYSSEDGGLNWNFISSGLVNPQINSLDVDGSVILAGTASGVYYSPDNGGTWSLVNNGLPSVTDVLIYGNSFLATNGSSLYKSTDNGQTWQENSVNALAINCFLKVDTTIYMAGANILYEPTIFKSENGGNTWTHSNLTESYGAANSLAVQGNFLYTTAPSYGVYKSDIGSMNWSAVNNDLINFFFRSNTVTSQGSEVFCGTYTGVFHSSNNGASWEKIDMKIYELNVELLATNGTDIFAAGTSAGVFRTSDDGNTWIDINNGIPSNPTFLFYSNGLTCSHDTVISSIYEHEVYSSFNNGSSWSHSSVGFLDSVVNAILIHDGIFYAGTSTKGIFISVDGGQNWIQSNLGITNLNITSLASYTNYLFAGTNGSGIFRSIDNGATWNVVNNGLAGYSVTKIIIDGSKMFAVSSCRIYTSDDWGSTWTELSFNEICPDAIAVKDSFIYVGAGYGCCVLIYKSEDYGNTFSLDTAGFKPDTLYYLLIRGDYAFAATGFSSVWRNELTSGSVGEANIVNRKQFEVYPMPAHNEIVFTRGRSAQFMGDLKILSVEAKILKSEKIEPGIAQQKLDLQSLSAGIYILLYSDSQTLFSEKIIKQ